MTAITLSTDPESKDNYGPYVPGIGASCPITGKAIRYNNIPDLEEVLETHGKNTAAFIVEPIQGEAGVVVPDEDYLANVQALCRKHNVLFICDEIQTGIGRTGRMLCADWAGIKPDMVTLGKAISGGMYPVSCVLSSKEIMMVVEPGTHGSTYGGNPLGCAVSIRALELMEEEGLTEKAERLGIVFREGMAALKSPIIKTIRGKGLLNAVVIDESAASGRTAWDLCVLLKSKGLLVRYMCINYVTLLTFLRPSPLTATSFALRPHWSLVRRSSKRELPSLLRRSRSCRRLRRQRVTKAWALGSTLDTIMGNMAWEEGVYWR